MIASGIAEGKWRNMEGDEGWRTVECLRGRLLAERVASRAAKEKAEEIGNKLTELEKLLKVEIKTRNRAEKRLQFLMKKLETLNIAYISDNSQHSSSMEKSDLSSVSSSVSWGGRESQGDKETNAQKTKRCSTASQDSEDNASQVEEKSNSSEPPRRDDLRSTSTLRPSREKEEINTDSCGEACEEDDDHVDNSLALVLVDSPETALRPVEPRIVSVSVKDALEALREAKEKLTRSMERRHVRGVGLK
ncbi:hypothetical protein NMG60_11000449 [Bertholletia excelsa]